MAEKQVHLDALRHVNSISQKVSDDYKEQKRKLSEAELIKSVKSDTLEELQKFKDAYATKEEMQDFGKTALQKSAREGFVSSYQYEDETAGTSSEGTSTRQSIQKMVDTPSEEFSGREGLAKSLQKHNDTLLMLSHVVKRAPQDLKYYDTHIRKNSELAKALTPDGASSTGQGAEWVPTAFSSDFINRMEQKYEVAGSIPKITIPQGSDSLKIPGAGAGISLVTHAASGATTDDGSNIAAATPGSRQITLTPAKLAIMVQIEEEAIEDMVVNVIQDITIPEMQNAAAKGVDDAIINGLSEDSTTLSDHAGTYSATDPRTAWGGLRYHAINAANNQFDMGAAGLSVAGIAGAAALLQGGSDNETFFDPPNNRLVVPLDVYLDLLTMTNVLQAEQIGSAAAATINSGQLASVLGIPIIQSQLVRKTDASGVVASNAATNTTNNAVLFNRNCFILGVKRDVTVKSRENIETDRRHVVLTFRATFASRYAAGTQSVALVKNIS